MAFSIFRKRFFELVFMTVMVVGLSRCGGVDKPFTLVPDTSSETQPTDGGGTETQPTDGSGGSGSSACYVNFSSQLQMKVSAKPAGAPNQTEILDAIPFSIDPIPLRVEGNNVTIEGDNFPVIYFRPRTTSADLKISGTPGVNATGTYDPATGDINIPNFQFKLEIVNKGTTDLFIQGSSTIPNATFTTGTVTATGNLNPIEETGQSLNSADKSLRLVIGLTLPTDFGDLQVLNTIIAGGALTARFDGTVDNLPENCASGGGGGTPAPGGSSGSGSAPSEFSVSDGISQKLTEVNFGSTPVIITKAGERTILDCKEATNRGVVTKNLTITNTGTGERHIRILKPQDTDNDRKDPLCIGETEFIRGSIQTTGSASCQTVAVAGRDFVIGDCTIPEGADNSIKFPVMYVPFNYVTPSAAAAPETTPSTGTAPTTPAPAASIEDTGTMLLEYDGGKTFALKMRGSSEPDTRDSFSISKVNNGTVSTRQIRNNGLINIALKDADPTPYTQKLVLQNSGTDSWEGATFSLEKTDSAFSVPAPASTTLGASDGTQPGSLEFDVVFNPTASATAYDDVLTITLNRAGNASSQSTLKIRLSGSKGLPTLSGKVKLQIDFLTAKIDHSVTIDPVESLDFRVHPDQAPPPLELSFNDTDDSSVKEVVLSVENKDVLQKNLQERKNSLRILNAQGTYGTPGRKLVAGEGADLCHEASNVNLPYDDSRQECSYFYFNIFGETPGIYDDDSRNMTIPNLTLRIQNPYHSDIAGRWPKSNPNGNPSNLLDTTMNVSLTTYLLDRKEIQESGRTLSLAPEARISDGQLKVKGKPLGKECPDDIFNRNANAGTLEEKHPHLLCYVSSDGSYLQGSAIALRPNQTKEYDVVLVGVGQFPSSSDDPNLPWFMGDGEGSRMYVAIQGRLIVE